MSIAQLFKFSCFSIYKGGGDFLSKKSKIAERKKLSSDIAMKLVAELKKI